MKNSWKRVAAGVLSFAMVAGAMPANVGGLLTGGKGIVASAAVLTEWTSTDSLPTAAGSYKLTSDVTLSSTWDVSADITLDLNGHGIRKNGDHVIRIINGATLTLEDSGDTVHYFDVENNAKAGKAFNVNDTSGSKSFTGGYITGGSGSSYDSYFWNEGGGIYVYNGHLIINGGTIIGNSSAHGGGVCIYSGDCVMNGGTVCYNSSGEGGGGIGFRTGSNEYNIDYVATEARFTMNGGSVTNNYNCGVATCGYSYGADYVTINGGTIADNTGTGLSSKNLVIDGNVTVTGNQIGVSYGNLKLSGNPTITGNTKNLVVRNNNPIKINGPLTNTTPIGIYTEPGPKVKSSFVFTNGISDHGTIANFSSDRGNTIKVNNAGELCEAPPICVTVPEDTVIVDGEGNVVNAADGVYLLKIGKTYTIYSDETLTPNTTTGLDISTQTDKEFGGKTYNYKYAVEFADTIADDAEFSFDHKHAAKAFSTDADHTDTDKVWAYCEGEPSEAAGCVAYLDTDGTYYYGEAPTADEVKLSEYFGATASVTDFFFTKKGDVNGSKVSPENMEIGETYVVNATIAVTIDNKVSNFAITREINFSARPLTECEVFLKNGETETPLTVNNGAVTVPADTFTYNGSEQKPEIIIKNTVLGTETTLTASDYTDTIEAQTNAGDYSATLTAVENANYSGSLIVNWKIQKAAISRSDFTATYKGKIYDGEVIDKDDFTFAAADTISPERQEFITALFNNTATNIVIAPNDQDHDLKSAGYQDVVIKISNPNFEDYSDDHFNSVNFTEAIDGVAIDERSVTITPDAEQFNTYRDTAAPQLTYTFEKASADSTTGVIAADEALFENTSPIAVEGYNVGGLNDAGTYSYVIANEDIFSNYLLTIAENAPTFTVKPLDLNTIEGLNIALNGDNGWTTDGSSGYYIYDGKTKSVKVDAVSKVKGEGETEYTLTEGEDYTVGGATKSATTGTKTVQIKGKKNYTGVAKASWQIKPSDVVPATLTLNIEGESKSYDGKAVTASISYDTENAKYADYTDNITDAEIKYYEQGSDTPLDSAPVESGNYVVKATVKSTGYSDQEIHKEFTIIKADLTIADGKNVKNITYGDELPSVTADDIAAIRNITDTDRAYFEQLLADGKLEFDNTDTSKLTIKLTSDADSEEYAKVMSNYGTDNFYWTLNTKAKSINSEDVTVEFANDDTVILDENGFVSESDIIVKDNGILNDGEAKVLAKETDYDMNIESTATAGQYTVEIVGKGNYKGVRKITFNAVSEKDAAKADGVNVALEDAVLKDGAKARFVLTPTLADGWTVDAYGIIYDKTGAVTDAEAAKSGLVLDGSYVTKTCSAKDGTPYALNVTPVDNNTVWAVGYITVSKGEITNTIYTEPKSGNVDDMRAAVEAEIESNVNVSLADAVLKDGTKARFLLTPEIADGWTVDAYGIVYDKTGAVTDAETAKSGLVLGGSYVTKTCSVKDGTSYALNVTPVDNNTVWAVGYVTVTKDGVTKTIYTEPKCGNVTEMQAKEDVKITLADAVLKDGTKARFLLTPEIKEGWNVNAYGIVYDKTGTITDAETAKSGLVLGGSYVTKTCSANDGTSYALNITPIDDNTIWAVGYVTVEKDGQTVTIYTSPKSAKVSDLKIQ